MGEKRNEKMIGIFVRIDEREGKKDYMKNMKSINDYMGSVIKNKVMEKVEEWLKEIGLMKEGKVKNENE